MARKGKKKRVTRWFVPISHGAFNIKYWTRRGYHGINLPERCQFLVTERAKKPNRIPVVLTTSEVATIFRHLKGRDLLFARILYGGGRRHHEGLRLRVKDVDVEARQLIVRDGKGAKDRVTVLPESVIADLLVQTEMVRRLHDADLADVNTTMIYTHVSRSRPLGVKSLLDRL